MFLLMIQIGIVVTMADYPDLPSCERAQAEIEKVIQYNPYVLTQCIKKFKKEIPVS